MSARTVEDRLREEYFTLLPEIRRTVCVVEAETHCLLVQTLQRLGSGERVHVESRAKDCESAVAALRRRQEGCAFEPTRAEIQVVPMLVGLFWKVEHSALYKPAAKLRGIKRGEEEISACNDEVIRALQAFERAFSNRVSVSG